MKSRTLLLAAIAGLVCGLLFRWRNSEGTAFSDASSRRVPVPLSGKNASLSSTQTQPQAVREWEALMERYLTGSVPLPSAAAAKSLRAWADQVLRLLREPVNEASIAEGVALINATGTRRSSNVMANVFERWVREAPEAALAAAQGLRVPMAKGALVWKVFEASAGEPGIMDKAMAQPEGITRSIALAALAEAVPAERASEALQEFIKGRTPEEETHSGTFESALFNLLRQGDIGGPRRGDAAAPLRLALEVEDPAWMSLMKTALNSPISLSTDQLEELARDPRNVEGLMDALSTKIHWEPAEWRRILAALPENKRHELLAGQTGFAMWWVTSGKFDDQRNTKGVGTFLQELEQTSGKQQFQSLMTESALNRGAQGLEDAAKWLSTRQESAGLEDLTRRAAVAEPYTTARWLAAMPLSAERDRAVAVFAETHAAVDPESAAVWAESISDPDKRAAALASVRKKSREATLI